MTETRRPKPGPGRVEEIAGRQEHFTFRGRVRMAWRLLCGQPVFGGFAESLNLFGGAETLTQDKYLVVELAGGPGEFRSVSAVKFRSLQLPFVIVEADEERHRENIATGNDLPGIDGIAFTDE